MDTSRRSGRPEITDERFKRQRFNLRLPGWVIDALKNMDAKPTDSAERAIVKYYKLKKPN